MEQTSPAFNPIAHFPTEEIPIENEPSPRLPGATSETRAQNFEALTAFQSQQTQHIGTSFSQAPLTGELLAQFQGTNEDHFSTIDQQLFQTMNDNLLIPTNESTIAHNLWYNDNIMTNINYNMPISNLPVEFPSASTLQREHIGSSQNQEMIPIGSSIYPSLNSINKTYSTPPQAQNINLPMPQPPSIPSRSIIIQDNIPNPMNAPSGFDLPTGNSTYDKSSDLSGHKRKMVWEDEEAPSYRSRDPSLRGYQRYKSSSIDDDDGGMYTLYDKRYEALGLPVDPHLRIFNTTNGNGSGESSKKAN